MKISRILRFTTSLIGGVIVGVAIAYVMAHGVENAGHFNNVPAWLLFLYVILLIYIAIAVHEAGHWLAGLGAGFRTIRLSVGPLMISRKGGRTAVVWDRSLPLMSGFTFMVPDDNRALLKRFSWFIIGGPLMSLIVGLLCLAAASMMLASGLRIAIISLGCLSFLLALFTLIPARSGGFHTDGAKLLMLWRGGETASHLLALLRLTYECQAGTRPRDWPGDAIAILEAGAPEGSDEMTASALLHMYARDTENRDLARTILERQLSSPDGKRSSFHANWCLEAALFAARYDSDPVKAREWQKEGKGARFVDAVTHYMIETEILLAERRFSEARKVYAKAVSALPKARFLPKGHPIEERLNDLDERIGNAEAAIA